MEDFFTGEERREEELLQLVLAHEKLSKKKKKKSQLEEMLERQVSWRGLWPNLHRLLDSISSCVLKEEEEEEENRRNNRRRRVKQQLGLVVRFLLIWLPTVAGANGAVGVGTEEEGLLPCLETLHSLLLRLVHEAEATANQIADICEWMWLTNQTGRHLLITQLVPFVLIRCLEPTSQKKQVKRVYHLRHALELIDLEDETSSTLLKDILLRCFLQPLFFSCDEGIKFLAFLLSSAFPPTALLPQIHLTIRNQLLHQKSTRLLTSYGQIYFKAWATSSQKTPIENDCFQPFFSSAIYAQTPQLFLAVRTLLLVIIDKKKSIKELDEMLSRLVAPILWRALKVSNPNVRCQAAIFLFDLFPLFPNTNNSKEANDLYLQKQFDSFSHLLQDEEEKVRIAAVKGVSKVLSLYWELLPQLTIKNLISKFLIDLVHDASSSGVRSAVFEGLEFVLDNHLTHSFLKPLLASAVRPFLHDKSEKVRLRFLLLLVRVKSIRGIHFYDIVSVDQLLERLILDQHSKQIRSAIVELFLKSFFPQGTSSSNQFDRCLSFIKRNSEASLIFYQSVLPFSSVGSVAKLSVILFRFLTTVAKNTDESTITENEPVDDILLVVLALISSISTQVLGNERFINTRNFLLEEMTVSRFESLFSFYENSKQILSLYQLTRLIGRTEFNDSFITFSQPILSTPPNNNLEIIQAIVDDSVLQDTSFFDNLQTSLADWYNHLKSSTQYLFNTKNEYQFHPLVAFFCLDYLARRHLYTANRPLVLSRLQSTQPIITRILERVKSKANQLQQHQADVIFFFQIYGKLAVHLSFERENNKIPNEIIEHLEWSSKLNDEGIFSRKRGRCEEIVQVDEEKKSLGELLFNDFFILAVDCLKMSTEGGHDDASLNKFVQIIISHLDSTKKSNKKIVIQLSCRLIFLLSRREHLFPSKLLESLINFTDGEESDFTIQRTLQSILDYYRKSKSKSNLHLVLKSIIHHWQKKESPPLIFLKTPTVTMNTIENLVGLINEENDKDYIAFLFDLVEKIEDQKWTENKEEYTRIKRQIQPHLDVFQMEAKQIQPIVEAV